MFKVCQRALALALVSSLLGALSFAGVRETHAQDEEQPRRLEGKSSQKIKKRHLGYELNSPFSELAPIISADGQLLFFTMGVGHPQNSGPDRLQDCYVSRRNTDGSWSAPKNLGSPINTTGNDALSGVSAEGNVLFIKNFAFNRVNGLCFARRLRGGWQIDSITIDNYSNSNPLASQCISSNANFIIFSAEMRGGYGGLDLYVSRLIDRATNHYGSPENLGPIINTSADDFTPFLAHDGQTLYFSSKGHKGFGDADMFVSKRLDDSWVNFTTPKNLGPQLNTPGMDAYYSVPASGDVAYYSSSNGTRHMDIFEVTLTEDIRPNPVILITGKITSKSNVPLEANVVYTHAYSDTAAAITSTNPFTGRYAVVVPYGEEYRVEVLAGKGYLPYSENLDFRKASLFREIKIDIVVDSAMQGGSITLNSIQFDLNKATLRPESSFELDKIVTLLNQNPTWLIQIEGHTDSLGGESYNQALSKARAESVMEYLVAHGVTGRRLTAVGRGAAEPLAANHTQEGRQLNRRVVFRLMQQKTD